MSERIFDRIYFLTCEKPFHRRIKFLTEGETYPNFSQSVFDKLTILEVATSRGRMRWVWVIGAVGEPPLDLLFCSRSRRDIPTLLAEKDG
jgi:hypothetical protein